MQKDTRPFVKRRVAFRGRRLTVIRDHILVDGKIRIRDWVQRPRVSAIVASKNASELILVRQYRHGVNRTLWELPAGTVDDKESPKNCAWRECEEETGYKPARLRDLGSFVAMPAESDEHVFLYHASGLKPTRMNLDADEKLVAKAFKHAEVKRMLHAGTIRDAKSIIGLYRFFYSK